ncbi:SHUGOSHIN 2-like isoform X2 [Tripterygium wilfordii]|uniref:SHUGOSHIN 2-like isoform X2 n=1 Tax=Tripterygium wilfordii TaxID=458696 RepID=UPI0018F7F476|nr:SHUGOSHIN 2-like isoform X2 [Tripterygium wilfordii]
MKGERMAKRASFESIMKKRLSDVSNSQSQPKLVTLERKQPQILLNAEDYINQLLKKNMALMKLIEERNKIIELSGTQLQNLRLRFQKLQLQNWHLAQSNTHMSAELNLGRERVKALQHELVCKDALLKSKYLEIEEQERGTKEHLHKANDEVKPSMGSSTTRGKENIPNKRHCLRRQSARLKSQEREPSENLFEIEDVKFSVTRSVDDPKHEDGLTPMVSSAKKEAASDSGTEMHVPRRSSTGRPMRAAVGMVQSYKEVPRNIKLRRKE